MRNTLKNNTYPFLFLIAQLFSFQLYAAEITQTSLQNTLIDYPWGLSQDKFLATEKENYESVFSENQAEFFVKKLPIMLQETRFKKIIKFTKEKGMSQISYMGFTTKDNVKSACGNVHEYLVKAFGKEDHQAKPAEQIFALYAWNGLQDSTIEEICISSGELNTITLTIIPKWQIFTCKFNNSESPIKYYFDSWNNQIRQFNQTEMSGVLKSTITPQKIQFTSKLGKERISIDRSSHEIIMKMNANTSLKGQCEVLP